MIDDLVKQPALRKWQESVYGNGPYQVPDYESMAAIVQEHEKMADRIEELEAKLDKAVDFCRRLERFAQGTNDQFLLDRCREILGELTDE